MRRGQEYKRYTFRGLLREAGQFILLTKHFFGRLFQNDLIDLEERAKAILAGALAVLATLLAWSSEMLLFKYQFLADNDMSWQEKSYLLIIVMILFGIITVVMWDIMFLDRRDYMNLSSLPIRLRTLFGAKLASFIAFVGIFSLTMNSITALLFSMYLAEWRYRSLVFACRYVLAHLIASFAACFSVFFAILLIQSLFVLILPRKASDRVCSIVRMLLLSGFVFSFVVLSGGQSIYGTYFKQLPNLMASGDSSIYWHPSLWFTGLYESLLGTSSRIYHKLAGLAFLSLGTGFVAFFLSVSLSYHRYFRSPFEASRNRCPLKRIDHGVKQLFWNLIMPRPGDRAVSIFFCQTLKLSQKHRMSLVLWLTTASGIVLFFLVTFMTKPGSLNSENYLFLILPLIVSTAFILGMRSIINKPIAHSAGWIFQMTERPETWLYVKAVLRTIFLVWLAPFFLIVLISHVPFFGWLIAARHAAIGLAISTAALEASFLGFRKAPFACTYAPGKTMLSAKGFLFVLLYAPFLTILGMAESAALRAPTHFTWFLVGSGAVWFIFRLSNIRLLKRASGLLYEEELTPSMITLADSGD